jgi:CrcB protein
MTTQNHAPVERVGAEVDRPAPPRRPRSWDPAVLAMIAAGGVLGAEARYGMSVLIPYQPGQWPWAIWLVNISGCFLIGVLMVIMTELSSPHRLVRPFLGVGVLGGYTTFSTYAVEVLQLHDAGRTAEALGYLAVTPVVAVVACAAGTAATRILWRRFPRPRTARR